MLKLRSCNPAADDFDAVYEMTLVMPTAPGDPNGVPECEACGQDYTDSTKVLLFHSHDGFDMCSMCLHDQLTSELLEIV